MHTTQPHHKTSTHTTHVCTPHNHTTRHPRAPHIHAHHTDVVMSRSFFVQNNEGFSSYMFSVYFISNLFIHSSYFVRWIKRFNSHYTCTSHSHSTNQTCTPHSHTSNHTHHTVLCSPNTIISFISKQRIKSLLELKITCLFKGRKTRCVLTIRSPVSCVYAWECGLYIRTVYFVSQGFALHRFFKDAYTICKLTLICAGSVSKRNILVQI